MADNSILAFMKAWQEAANSAEPEFITGADMRAAGFRLPASISDDTRLWPSSIGDAESCIDTTINMKLNISFVQA